MKITRGEGTPFLAFITDGSPSVEVIIKRFLDSINLSKGRLEVIKYKKDQHDKIMATIKEANAIVEFISAPIETSTQGVHVCQNYELTDFDRKTRKLTQMCKPYFIIRESIDDATSEFMKELVNKEMLVTGFRVSPLDQLTEYAIGHVIEGFKQLLQFHEMLPGGFLLRTLATFKRHQIFAVNDGEFETKHILLETPEEHSQLFKVKKKEGEDIVESPKDQKIIELHKKGFVKKGELLMSLGESIPF